MRLEITIDCVDDTLRRPRGQVISWIVRGPKSRDARMREIGQMIADVLHEHYPKPRDGVTFSGVKTK